MFGPHLILEGYGCSRKTLGDVALLYKILDEYPDMIGMTKIMPPHVQQYLEKPDKLWGLSGFVIIAESHIAIHTFPERNFLTLDIFSCKDFLIETAIDYVVDNFHMRRHEHKVLGRGADYPRDIRKAVGVMKAGRGFLRAVDSSHA
jgi:S-adenosylmethionine decarboxylase